MEDQLQIRRTVYRELFNNICADFSLYRLHHLVVDDEFARFEQKLWSCRESALNMAEDDMQKADDLLTEAKAYLVRKGMFESW